MSRGRNVWTTGCELHIAQAFMQLRLANQMQHSSFVGCRHFSGTRCLSSHYQTLQVPIDAASADIKKKYYELSKLYHPDKNKNSKEAASQFIAISEAYDTLKSPTKRRQYDERLFNPIAFTESSTDIHSRQSNEARRRREDIIWNEIWKDINDDLKQKPKPEEVVVPLVLPRWTKVLLAVIFSWKAYILWNHKKRAEKNREEFLRGNTSVDETSVMEKAVSAVYKISTTEFGPKRGG